MRPKFKVEVYVKDVGCWCGFGEGRHHAFDAAMNEARHALPRDTVNKAYACFVSLFGMYNSKALHITAYTDDPVRVTVWNQSAPLCFEGRYDES